MAVEAWRTKRRLATDTCDINITTKKGGQLYRSMQHHDCEVWATSNSILVQTCFQSVVRFHLYAHRSHGTSGETIWYNNFSEKHTAKVCTNKAHLSGKSLTIRLDWASFRAQHRFATHVVGTCRMVVLLCGGVWVESKANIARIPILIHMYSRS